VGASDLLRSLMASGFAVEVCGGGALRVSPASGLTDDHRHAIRLHKADLAALLSSAPSGEAEPVPGRPYALPTATAHRAHARPWNNAAIGRFNARVQRFRGFGWSEQDAEDLAERAHLADIERDDRRPCLECARFRGVAGNLRCGSPAAAGLHGAGADRAAIGAALATTPQRCPGFQRSGDD
jgi:hypothetical protein